MMDFIALDWVQLKDSISELHELPIFLPQEWIMTTLMPTVTAVALALTVTYLLTFYLVEKSFSKGTSVLKKSKISYQITNALFNTVVGFVGLFLQLSVLPTLNAYQGTSVERAIGDHSELYMVSAMQLGYQFWALPVGILHVGESTEMIMHHLAVVVSTSMSGFLTVGFRYYTPFFYGIMELSSLPLALMNSFKDNPDWIKQYPAAYTTTRISFALCFLLIRVVLLSFVFPSFLRDNFLFMYTCKLSIFKFYLLVQWSLAAFLMYLQFHWGTLIVKGLWKMFAGRKREKV